MVTVNRKKRVILGPGKSLKRVNVSSIHVEVECLRKPLENHVGPTSGHNITQGMADFHVGVWKYSTWQNWNGVLGTQEALG